MNTKLLMTASALFLLLPGLGFTFMPQEISEYFNSGSSPAIVICLQLLGALYLGFAMLNWMAKNNLIGGIYSKPLVIGNLTHFMISVFALIKIVGNYSDIGYPVILAFTILYSVLALLFGYVFMTTPSKVKTS